MYTRMLGSQKVPTVVLVTDYLPIIICSGLFVEKPFL